MAALNFPDTPAVGDVFGSLGTVWRWDGARWASTAGASGARGAVAYAQVVANQSTTGVETALTGLSVSPTLVAGRTYKITTQILYNAGFSEQRALLRIRANGTQLQLAEADATTAPNAALACQVVYTAAASGAVTFASSLGPVAGGATLLMVASSIQPAFILVEDITYEAGSGPGSAIESGSNANGEWIKFPDGTMQCWRRWSTTVSLTAYGSLFIGAVVWTFPQPFAVIPVTSVGGCQVSTGATWGVPYADTTTTANIRIFDVVSRPSEPVAMAASAIGKWK